MSIALVVTRGYGNGTLTGSLAKVVTRGYTPGVISIFFGIKTYSIDVVFRGTHAVKARFDPDREAA